MKTNSDWTSILLASEATIISTQDFKKKRNANYYLITEKDFLDENVTEQYSDIFVTPEFVIQCFIHQMVLDRTAYEEFTAFKEKDDN